MNTTVKTIESQGIPVPAKYLVILGVAFLALFLISLDQGQTLSIFMGDIAYEQKILHEVFHDIRHAVGFACH